MASVQKCGYSESRALRTRHRSKLFADYQYSSSESDSDVEMASKRGAGARDARAQGPPSPRSTRSTRSPRRVQLIGARMRLLPPGPADAADLPLRPTPLHSLIAPSRRWVGLGGGWVTDAGSVRVLPQPASPDQTEEEECEEEYFGSESDADGVEEECGGRGCGFEPTGCKKPPEELEWAWSDADSTCSELAFDSSTLAERPSSAIGDCVSRSLAPTYSDDEASDDTLCGCSD